MARPRYTLIGKARTADDDLSPIERLLAGRRMDYYVFTANMPIQCMGGSLCDRTIEAGERFTRAEVNQRAERFSRWPTCRDCRPFTVQEETASCV